MENFKKLGSGTGKVNVIIRSYGITFSRACVAALNNARFVTLALDEETIPRGFVGIDFDPFLICLDAQIVLC